MLIQQGRDQAPNRMKRGELTERALKIFILHYYSLEWLRDFLLERRFKSMDYDLHTVPKYVEKHENNLLLCVKTAIELFPTARGLHSIDFFLMDSYHYFDSDEENHFFSGLNRSYCKDTRYRMGLLMMAQDAQNSGHSALARLWYIAATADLKDIRAYQTYAAAKEEESRVLFSNHFKAEYWKQEKSYEGDFKEKKFSPSILSIQMLRESSEKEKEFKQFLRMKAKADPTFPAEIIESSNLKDTSFLSVWCCIRGMKSEEQRLTGFWWRKASDLYRGTDNNSWEFAKEAAYFNRDFEDKIARRILLSAFYQKEALQNSGRYARLCKSAAALSRDQLVQLKSIINSTQEENLQVSDITTLRETLERLTISRERVYEPFLSYSFNLQIKLLLEQTKLIDQVLTSMSSLTVPDVDLLSLIQGNCERLESNIFEYFHTLERIARLQMHLMEVPEELKDQVDKWEIQRLEEEMLLKGYLSFFRTLKILMTEKLHSLPDDAVIDKEEEAMRMKISQYFISSYHTVQINKSYARATWISESTQSIFFNDFRELISFAKEWFLQRSEIAYLQLVDISYEMISLRLRHDITDRSYVDDRLFYARKSFKEAMQSRNDEVNRLDKIVKGETIREVARLLLKVIELERDVKKDEMVVGDKRKEKNRLIHLYSKVIDWMKEILRERQPTYNEANITLYYRIAGSYLAAATSFEKGQTERSIEHEREIESIVRIVENTRTATKTTRPSLCNLL